jgi:hypothetical protein
VYLAPTFAVPLIAPLAAISLSEIDRPSAAQLCAKRTARRVLHPRASRGWGRAVITAHGVSKRSLIDSWSAARSSPGSFATVIMLGMCGMRVQLI